MEYRRLGKSNLMVSRLCFGSLTLGPLQAKLPIEDGAQIIAKAFELGVNFIDTAKLYNTYPYIKRALELSGNKDVIISSKSYDYTYEGMQESVREALEELGLKKLGIFSLHEQESRLTLRGHEEALRYLCDAKKMGIIEAVGVSTHAVEVVEAVSSMDCVDIIHPIINKVGLGIIDGTIDDMLGAVIRAHGSGKGIYGMKLLGGGNLMKNALECFRFGLENTNLDSIAVGIQSVEELYNNVRIFEGHEPDYELQQRLADRNRRLHIDDWCEGCGKCEEFCQNKGIYIMDGKARAQVENCVLCGYCSAHCPLFCIKII